MSTRDTRRLRAFRHVQIGNSDAVLIPLHGKMARRYRARLILDPDVWTALSTTYANHYSLVREHGWMRVEGRMRPIGKPANRGQNARVVLKRLVAGAAPGQRVLCINGDPCDLRRCNLKLVNGIGDERPVMPLPAADPALCAAA